MPYENGAIRVPHGPGPGRQARSREAAASTASCTNVWAIIPMIRIRRGRAGRRLFRTTVGPIRKTIDRVEIPY